VSSALPMKKDELSELFKLASLEKKKKLEEKLKIKHQTKVFEDWLYSDKTKKKQIIDEHVDKNVKKIVNVEPKQDLIEQSLGLLAEPSDVKQVSDPLTPIDQNFATLDDLQNHYKLFLNRIQQQLSTLGGGGAINIKDMEDVDLLTAEVNDKYLKYDSSSKKWVGADTSGGGGSSDKIEEGNTKAEVVDTGSNGHFLVETEGNERARIDASGRMGIGTSLPNSILHLKQTSDAVYMTFDSNSNTPFWVGSTGINTGFFIEQANTNNSILTSDANDYVFLYGAGTKRLETTGIGISVNGKTDTIY